MASYVQHKTGQILGPTSNPNTVAVTFDSTPSAGNFITVTACGYAGATSCTISMSDNKGNTYTVDKQQHEIVSTGHIQAIGSAYISSTSATFTVTVSITNTAATGQYIIVSIEEWSGVYNSAADKTASQIDTASTTTVDTTATGTTAFADSLIVALGSTATGTTGFTYTHEQSGTAPASGWTTLINDTSILPHVVEYVFVTSTVAARHVWSCSLSEQHAGVIATYRLQVVPPPSAVTWVGYIG